MPRHLDARCNSPWLQFCFSLTIVILKSKVEVWHPLSLCFDKKSVFGYKILYFHFPVLFVEVKLLSLIQDFKVMTALYSPWAWHTISGKLARKTWLAWAQISSAPKWPSSCPQVQQLSFLRMLSLSAFHCLKCFSRESLQIALFSYFFRLFVPSAWVRRVLVFLMISCLPRWPHYGIKCSKPPSLFIPTPSTFHSEDPILNMSFLHWIP